jgi:hypothetical protein
MVTPKTFLAAALLVGFCLAQVGSAFAEGTKATFYTNSLTNTAVPLREHFIAGGGGYGSFEINEEVGLELLSEAPNWYEAVRAFKIPLSAGVSWEVTVRAHVSRSLGANQTNPSYQASLVLTKVTKTPDGFSSVLSTAPSRHVLSLARSDGLSTNSSILQNVVTSYRKSQGEDVEDTRVDIGNQEDLYLRFTYSADEKQLTASASTNGLNFQAFETANLGDEEEWQLEDTDALAVALSVSSVPYVHVDQPSRDFYSTYDSYGTGEFDPAVLPEIKESVNSGDVYLKDLSIVYTPSAWDADTFSTYELEDGGVIVYYWDDRTTRHIAVPEFINGKPVRQINAFSKEPSDSSLVSVVLPASLTQIWGYTFSGLHNLITVNVPPTIQEINQDAFADCPQLANVVLPDRFVFRSNYLGLDGTTAYRMFVQQIADSLAENELFMAALATNEKFIGLLTFKILSRFQAYGLVTRNDLSNYATIEQIDDAFSAGQADGVNSVVSNPNAWQLYTANQVSGLSIGDLTLTRQENGSFVLNYDIEQSNDLVTWTTYRNYGEELTGLPTNKKFIRIRVKQ